MTRLPSMTGREIITALRKAGFQVIRVRGSHHILKHPDGRRTVVPVHRGEAIGPGLMTETREIARSLARSYWSCCKAKSRAASRARSAAERVGCNPVLGRRHYVVFFLKQFVSHKLHRAGYQMPGSKR